MPEREFKVYPERLTDVLDADVVHVLVTGYSQLTKSPISIMERAVDGKARPLGIDPKLYRSPVCKAIDQRPEIEEKWCGECDRLHVNAVLDGDIREITPYLCPFGQVDVVVPVRIGAMTVAVFFGGQAPFDLWPQDLKERMVAEAVKDGYLERLPGVLDNADREIMTIRFKRLGITDRDPDELLKDARQYMEAERGQADMVGFLQSLGNTAAIIERLANEKYFGDLQSHIGGMILGQPAPAEGSATEEDLWHDVQRALSIVRRVMGFAAAIILTNRPDSSGHFEIAKRIRIRQRMIGRIEKRKGPCVLDVNRLQAGGLPSSAEGTGVQKYLHTQVRRWLLGPDLDPMWAIPVSLDPGARRWAVLVLFGSERDRSGHLHLSERESAMLQRVSGQLVASTQTRYADLAVREWTELQEMFMEELRHELKAPIQSIMAQAHLLISRARRRELSSDHINRADYAIRAEVEELVTRMANISLISVLDKVELRRKPMHVRGVVRECVTRYQPIAAQNSITLALRDLSDRSAWSLVHIDPERFALVVDNLVHNAIKYSHPHTAVRVEIGETSTSVVLRVTNVGARVPRDKYDRIFDKFARLTEQESQFRFRPGTGIGLAIVRRMVALHEGHVRVESNQAEEHLWPPHHKGRPPFRTVFTVELPKYTQKEG